MPRRLDAVGLTIERCLLQSVAERLARLGRFPDSARAVEAGHLARSWGRRKWAELTRDHAEWEATTREQLQTMRVVLGGATALLGERWEAVTRSHLSRIQAAGAGTAAGVGAGALLGGGSVGIVAFGTGIGIPLIAITALVGLVAGNRIGIELEYLREQWRAASDRSTAAKRVRIEAERRDETAQARFIVNREHDTGLQEALDAARSSLCIRSAFLSDYVANRAFAASIRGALARGVDVYLEYGYRMPLPSHLAPQPRQEHSNGQSIPCALS